MFETVPIEKITSPYGEERFKTLDREHIDHLKKYYIEGNSTIHKLIFITKDYKIIDGHHRYLALREVGVDKEIKCIKFNCWFEDTDKLRDFQKHLKGMVPENWHSSQLKYEFEDLLPWLLNNVLK